MKLRIAGRNLWSTLRERGRLDLVVRVAITVGGLALVLGKIKLEVLRDILLGASPTWLLSTFLLVNVSLVVRAFRWFLLLRGLGRTTRFGRLVTLYFAGNFFNAFLPTSFGGDVIRVVEVTRDVPADVAAGTVIVDRLSGLLMLFVIALGALPFRPDDFPVDLLRLVVGVSVLGILGGVVLLEGSLVRRFGGWLPGKLSPVGEGPVAKVLRSVNACGRRAIFGALGVSLLFNLILALWWWAAGRSLGFAHVPYMHYLLVIPILSISLLVPSIGGLGPREAVAPTLFRPILIGTEAVALSLLVFLLQRLSSLVGGLVYLGLVLSDRSGIRSKADESVS